MPSVTIRNIPDEVHRRLRIRAAKNGRSMEAELRAVLAIVAGVARSRTALAASGDAAEAVVEALPDSEPAAPEKVYSLPPDSALNKVRELLKTQISEDAA